MPRNDAKNGTREAAAARRRTALTYRIAGLPYRTIGEKLGVSGVQAFRDVQAALADARAKTRESAGELVQLERERIGMARGAIATRVHQGDLGAIDRWIRLSESERKLLGLDAPEKIAHTEPDGAPRRSNLANLSIEELVALSSLLARMESGGGGGESEDDETEE